MFYIGTSGWTYSHWQGEFYPLNLPQKEWLRFYAQHFKTVEINATFYHSMKPETFLNWRKTVGDNFIFSIKASRFITHIKRLKNCQEEVKTFFEAANSILNLKSKILNGNIILWQLPPKFKIDLSLLEKFLPLLPKNWRYAFEFRDRSWLCDKVYELLKKYNTALVIQDSPYWPAEEVVTTNYTYLRFHGGQQLYTSNYSQKELEKWAKKMIKWNKEGIDVYAYFNNDALGYAVKNAKTLIEMVTLI